MGRVFQGAATVDSVLRGDLIEKAAEAGLRSLFVGFESVNSENHQFAAKKQNLNRDYDAVVERLDSLGIMINGSFVFGLDHDTENVFDRTVDWAVEQGVTTATFHIATPYPGTEYHKQLAEQHRIVNSNWDHYDTRHVVFKPKSMTSDALLAGYHRAYKQFYSWSNIGKASMAHGSLKHSTKHFFYSAGWKKFEPVWDVVIRARQLQVMTPLLEGVLSKVTRQRESSAEVAPEATRPQNVKLPMPQLTVRK